MSTQDRERSERFRIRPRPPRSRTGRSGRAFVTHVIAEMSQVGRGLGRAGDRGNHAMSRGQVAARFAGDRLQPQSRRVVIKTRLVILASTSSRAVQTHLRYIARDGVTPDGAPGVAYDAQGDHADLHAFEQRGRGDRHQFRFIIAPENAVELEDLHAFTGEFMARMEVDVGSRLDWVAVDHWDTDNPHTHVVLRGRHEAGHDLVLAREYISRGMRFRASELATEWLGPRTELEIRQSLSREVAQERWTGLDQALTARSIDGVVNLSQRTESKGIRGLVNNLLQSDKYGTPLAQSLRVLSAEFREERMMRAEEKAARLPALMTVPMIVFILPPLFIVLIGPAILQVIDAFRHMH